ncbi:MAG TPA: type II toxin-antitoxin system CcdA family antitoxin [Gallionella sp.]|nr:type II toxin-antitoxin system CcdA family antitoxin [Gallionella sp.]
MEYISSDQTATDNSANLSVNADALRQAQSERWLTENRDALEEYNCRIEARGTFSDGLRRF